MSRVIRKPRPGPHHENGHARPGPKIAAQSKSIAVGLKYRIKEAKD